MRGKLFHSFFEKMDNEKSKSLGYEDFQMTLTATMALKRVREFIERRQINYVNLDNLEIGINSSLQYIRKTIETWGGLEKVPTYFLGQIYYLASNFDNDFFDNSDLRNELLKRQQTENGAY